MITVASHEARIVLGRLDQGADLIAGLLDVCRQRQIRTGTVVALGALQAAEVAHYDFANKRYRPGRTLLGPLEILSAVGNVSELEGELSLHLHVTLSREGDNGVEVLGGHVLSGAVFACEFSITALDDVMLRRGVDDATGLSLWKEGFEREGGPTAGMPVSEMGRVSSGSSGAEQAAPASKPDPEPDPEPEPAPATKAKSRKRSPASTSAAKVAEPSWADVAAASQKAQGSIVERTPLPPKPRAPEPPEEDEEADDELDYLEVEPGDIVEHPKFKRCKVARVEGDMEFVQVRLRNGNLVRLSLDIVRLVLVGSEGGHQVFKAIIDA